MGKYIFRVGSPCCGVSTKEPDEETIMQLLYNILVEREKEDKWENVFLNFSLRKLGDIYYLNEDELPEDFDFYEGFSWDLLWYNFKTGEGGFIEYK